MRMMVSDRIKSVRSPKYNFDFDKKSGFFLRWGATTKTEDDPDYSPPGPEIADIEVTTICYGLGGKLCPFCYKANGPNGINMPFSLFKTIFHKFPLVLCQIAFGVDAQGVTNPDIWKMMEYCRTNSYNQVIPNITVAEVNNYTADKLSELCGAVAVSRYKQKHLCYDSVKLLTDRGMIQTNIHIMIADETFDLAMETINDANSDPRLEKLNAIVFLSLKRKGRGVHFTPLPTKKFTMLVNKAFEKDVVIGFDSCSAPKFLQSVKERPDYKSLEMCSEPCESSLFSAYINVEGDFFPCSFVEGEEGWKEGICVSEVDSFLSEVWNHSKTVQFRNKVITNKDSNNCRMCPIFDI